MKKAFILIAVTALSGCNIWLERAFEIAENPRAFMEGQEVGEADYDYPDNNRFIVRSACKGEVIEVKGYYLCDNSKYYEERQRANKSGE